MVRVILVILAFGISGKKGTGMSSITMACHSKDGAWLFNEKQSHDHVEISRKIKKTI